MSEGFIDGIFNYCDRWCERCPLTTRCRLFAMERELSAESDKHNEEFCERLDAAIDRLSYGLSEEESDWNESAEEALDSAYGDGEYSERAETHPLASSATDYGFVVFNWFKAHKDRFPDDSPMPVAASFQRTTLDANEAVEVIRWYEFQIGVKLTRAVSGLTVEADESWLNFDEGWQDSDTVVHANARQQDSAGSARVALIGIERSIGAWTVLRDALPDLDTYIVAFLSRLTRLRRQTDDLFPKARTFHRPGLDDLR